MGTLNIIAGGKGTEMGDALPVEVYDIALGIWITLPKLGRFRHSAWIHDGMLCITGGFESSAPNVIVFKQQSLELEIIVEAKKGQNSNANLVALNIGAKPQEKKEQKSVNSTKSEVKEKAPSSVKEHKDGNNSKKFKGSDQYEEDLNKNSFRSLKLSPRVLVAMSFQSEVPASMRRIVKSLSVNNLIEESKKLVGTNKVVFGPSPDEIAEAEHNNESIAQMFINHLLRPKDWANNRCDRQFIFGKEDILSLANECLNIIKKQPTVVNVRVPVKIFGDFHGQYQDMMRFFDLWRGPTEASHGGDIESYDYLFLGDYVDRGSYSLETICLLLALKVKYPNQIHLLRGNHEDISINQAFGFAEECEERLDDDLNDESSVFLALNLLFEWLPLAGVVEDRILCLHGGIGSKLNKISDLEKLQRPIQVIHEVQNLDHQLVIDVLWSDPTDTDEDMGIQNDVARDPNNTGFIVKYGPDRIENFLTNNDLTMIIRGHECVMDGIERFARGQLITVFSATDYCGKHKNAGAALFIQKDYEIVAKLIYPLDMSKDSNWIDNSKPQTGPDWRDDTNDHSFG